MLKKYLKRAGKEKWAIGQFNFSTLDQLKAILESSKKMRSPVILGTSRGEANFFGIEEAANLISFYKKSNKNLFFLNLDHGTDLEIIKKAVDAGYDMVHFDGSKMNLEENIKETKKVLKYANRKGVLVEGEIGHIFGKSSLNKKEFKQNQRLPSIEEVHVFFKKTKVDLLALAVGNVHGIYPKMPSIDFNLLKEAQKIGALLVFHGASGFSDKEIIKAIKCGVVKININTELRVAWKESIKKEVLTENFAPYEILLNPQKEVSLKVEEKIKLFGSRNKA